MSIPDLIEKIFSGGAIAIMAVLLAGVLFVVLVKMPKWLDARDELAARERALFLKAIQDLSSKAEMALDRNTEAINKLESAVEKLERRLDDHDRMLERMQRD